MGVNQTRLLPLTFDTLFGSMARSGRIPLGPYMRLKALFDKDKEIFRRDMGLVRKAVISASARYIRRWWWPLPDLKTPWLRKRAVSFVREIEQLNSTRIEILIFRLGLDAMREAGGIEPTVWSAMASTPRRKRKSRKSKKYRRAHHMLLDALLIFIQGIANGYFPGIIAPSAGLLSATASASASA